MRNVSRAWAYETGLAAGVELAPGWSLVRSSRLVLIWSRNTRERIL
jgi:hypothetical protein